MKAVVYERYGAPEVLELKDVPAPVPKKNEILVKVYATSVTAGDWRMRKAEPFMVRIFSGLTRPSRVKILGFEIAGVIEKIGENVKSFNVGDSIFASCGYKFGGYAEYKCLAENAQVALKPVNMSFEEAATVPIGGLSALQFLRQAGIKSNDDVLIYGASGSVGTFAIQLAKCFGAKVVGVCSSKNIELVRGLGAENVIDYTKEDFTKTSMRFNIILDAVGKTSKSDCRHLLKAGGKYVSVSGRPKVHPSDLQTLKTIIESGHLKTVIDRTYRLEQIRDAHAYVEQFHKRGNVSVKVV